MSTEELNSAIPKDHIKSALERARVAVEAGDKSYKRAAEHLATAKRQGATQRQMAEAIGKSQAWVNRLLAWRTEGYLSETAFGPQSKSKRDRARDQAANQKVDIVRDQNRATIKDPISSIDENDEMETHAGELAVVPDEDSPTFAAKLRFGSQKSKQPKNAGEFSPDARSRLVMALENLTTMNGRQRTEAALVVSKIRREIALQWNDLIIPATKSIRDV